MTAISKPTDLNKIWASGGDVLTPSDSKIGTGWEVEIPPRQWFNWLDNRQDQAIAHFNQYGVAVWDSVTEYQANKSYTQGPTNGTIYRCVSTHTNQNPETDLTNTYWQVAFAGAGDFYTKAEADANYLSKALNGSDIPNPADFRTSISVYSTSQTYTKSEVDAKTTIASTAQSQALTSNTTLITPLRLSEAFKGSNQSFSSTGYQKIPGGFIIQWGTATATITGTTVTLPVAFPTACLSATATPNSNDNLTASTGYSGKSSVFGVSTTSFTIRCDGSVFWIAIGY